MNIVEYYLVLINIFGFCLFAINVWLYSNTSDGQVDTALTIVSLLGGSLGIILSILLFDRKAKKGNMMSRVFVACLFVIQIIMLLIFKGYIAENLTLAFWEFFSKYKIFLVYLGMINIVTFVAFLIDRLSAIKHRTRIRIVTLLGLAFIGGSLGGLLAMYMFRHKINKDYFTVGIPLIIFTQIVLVFYLMNMG